MALDLDELLLEFDDRADDVGRSKHDFFSSNLKRWFSLLDETPEIAGLIKELENAVDFDSWKEDGLTEQSGMGHGRIVLPNNSDERLGILIGLFRSLTESEDAPWRFAHTYVSSERNLNDNIYDLVTQVFEPFARDLRRRISRVSPDQNQVPAADRIVQPDHNSRDYLEALSAVEKVKETIIKANDYPDFDDKEQRLSELNSGKILLNAPRFRLQAVTEVLVKCLTYLAKKFADAAIGIAAAAAVAALIALFGFI